MNIDLGHTNIKDDQDVINFRLKLVKIFDILFDNYVFAIKMSSLISTFLKRIHADYDFVSLESHIRLERAGSGTFCIKISSNTNISVPQLLKKYNSAIDLKETDGSILIEIQGILNSENFELVKHIYSKPRLDDLMQELKEKNKYLEESFENLKKAKDLNARMENELEVGKNIQMSMLPVDFPTNNEIDLYAKLIPAREVGGDFYDFHLLNDHLLYFAVGDVSGKGVPAALFMAVCKTLLKSKAINDYSPASIITHVNNEIAMENKNYMFITLFLAILDLRNGKMKYSNAGHNPTLIKRKSHDIIKLDKLSGPVIGAVEGISYTEEEIKLEMNDIVLAYTDGVTEAQDKSDQLFSDERLINFFAENVFNSSEKLVIEISEEVMEFEMEKEQADDITIMVLTYRNINDMKRDVSFSMEITNKISEIQTVARKSESFLINHLVDRDVIRKINIIHDEVLSNVIKYAFADEHEHVIRITVEINQDNIILTIKDHGLGFNPFTLERPDLSLSVEERSIGGLGIHIVKSIANDYSYERKDETNIVKLIMKI